MGPADTLSFKDDIDTSDDNHMVILLPSNDTQNHNICHLDLDLADKIKHSSASDPIVTKVLTTMNDEFGEPWLPHTSKEDWTFAEGSL